MLNAKFVGAEKCAICHQRENSLWLRSHHHKAMLRASESTVLGDFNHTEFRYNGVTSTFFREGSKFEVRTDGPDGVLHNYEIAYTFGVYPLQQYLIAIPGGRLQALGIAWDSRARQTGGQRWFFLYPGQEIGIGDPRHWTGIDQTWNYMCADCHSTNVRKNYDARTRFYSTSYSEMDVSCEACHGPGSNHIKWAKRQDDWKSFVNEGLTIALDEYGAFAWLINRSTGNATRSAPRQSEREIQMCARCHSRRGEIREDYVHGQPVSDDYRIALLDEGLYFPDGQIKEEDYEYGSFIQSKMFHSGVTCSDCHESHSSKLRAAGNAICAQCHMPQKYDSPAHHFHKEESAGSRCVECHMPTRTYMVVDARRDHSIRIPRPDLSAKMGTPNPCTNCHSNKSAQWAAESVSRWYGHRSLGFQQFANALNAGVIGGPGARRSLEELVVDRGQPAIARASALWTLADYPPPPIEEVRGAVGDESPLVRRAAAHALSNSIQPTDALLPLLTDPVRSVRIEAAEVLAGLPQQSLSGSSAATLNRALEEYVSVQELNADRPEAHLNLGSLYAKQKRSDLAENELKTALSLDRSFVPAAVNLADLYRAQNRDDEGERVLTQALKLSPDDASLDHVLGLLMVRQKHTAQALELLGAAARNAPGNARYAYVYAIALNESGKTANAIKVLKGSLKEHPYHRDSLEAIAAFLKQSGERNEALPYIQRLRELGAESSLTQQGLR